MKHRRLFIVITMIVMVGLLGGCHVLPQQKPPDIGVTSERIKQEVGYELFVPEGASEFEYRMNVDSHVGYVGFLLDGVTYTAKVKKSDSFISIENPKVEENWRKCGEKYLLCDSTMYMGNFADNAGACYFSHAL